MSNMSKPAAVRVKHDIFMSVKDAHRPVNAKYGDTCTLCLPKDTTMKMQVMSSNVLLVWINVLDAVADRYGSTTDYFKRLKIHGAHTGLYVKIYDASEKADAVRHVLALLKLVHE